MFIPTWSQLLFVFAVLLALGAIDQRRRKALSKLQEEIDEIKEQLAELESKVSNLQPEREIELNETLRFQCP
jgi:FtsZ-binding cell division protein ZapB